jgi:hypothetical protein
LGTTICERWLDVTHEDLRHKRMARVALAEGMLVVVFLSLCAAVEEEDREARAVRTPPPPVGDDPNYRADLQASGWTNQCRQDAFVALVAHYKPQGLLRGSRSESCVEMEQHLCARTPIDAEEGGEGTLGLVRARRGRRRKDCVSLRIPHRTPSYPIIWSSSSNGRGDERVSKRRGDRRSLRHCAHAEGCYKFASFGDPANPAADLFCKRHKQVVHAACCTVLQPPTPSANSRPEPPCMP